MSSGHYASFLSSFFSFLSYILSFTPSSISTGEVSSGHSASHTPIISGYAILGSVALLFLCWTVLSLSYYWDNTLSPFCCTLCKLISLNLSSIVSTLNIVSSRKYEDEKVGSLYGGESLLPSLSSFSSWTYVHYFHKVDFWHWFILFASGKQVLLIAQIYLLTHVHNLFLPDE